MALFFDWKVVRVLMVVGLSSPLSKSSFILFYSWCFCTPKARLRARSGSEPLYGSAWFGSVWGGFLGGILGGIARAGFSHRESALPDPLNY